MLFLSNDETRAQQIEPMTGLSPELLNLIQCCNELAFGTQFDQREAQVKGLLHRLGDLQQTVKRDDVYQSELSDEETRERLTAVKVTAETYRQAAILYVHCRILGFVFAFVKPDMSTANKT